MLGGTDTARTAERLDVSFVCTGNQARSVLAAALFRRETDGLPVLVSSFGTMGVEGRPPLPEAAALARALGLDVGEHRSRAVQPGCLRSADLVIGFERAHVAAAIDKGEARAGRAFLLLELPELLQGLEGAANLGPVDAARRTITQMELRRTSSGAPTAREVPDPVGRSKQDFAELGRVLEAVVVQLAAKLFAVGGRLNRARVSP